MAGVVQIVPKERISEREEKDLSVFLTEYLNSSQAVGDFNVKNQEDYYRILTIAVEKIYLRQMRNGQYDKDGGITIEAVEGYIGEHFSFIDLDVEALISAHPGDGIVLRNGMIQYGMLGGTMELNNSYKLSIVEKKRDIFRVVGFDAEKPLLVLDGPEVRPLGGRDLRNFIAELEYTKDGFKLVSFRSNPVKLKQWGWYHYQYITSMVHN